MSPSHLIAVLLAASTAGPSAFVSIPDIQYTTAPGGDSPYAGQIVTTSGVVTAVYAGGFVVQDPNASLWSGIWVYDPDYRPEAGDSLELTGTVSEYFGLTELGTLTTYQVLARDSPLPAPASVSVASVATGSPTAESYEGVLVTCPGVRVSPWAVGGDWRIGDATGEVIVSDRADYLYQSQPDDSLAYVSGVLLYSWNEFRIEPRFEEDIGRLDVARFALRGVVVTPDEVLPDAYVVVNRRHIEGVTATAPNVPIHDTGGVIFPALIDAHNHPAYNVFDVLDFGQLFNNRYEWQSDPDYIALRNIYNGLVAQGLLPQMWKYSEARSVIWGTGTVQGSYITTDWEAYAHAKFLTRNLERFPGRVYSSIFPMNLSESSRQNLKNDIAGGVYRATVIHLSEGVDAASLDEFTTWQRWGMLDNTTVIIHGIPYGPAEFAQMAAAGASLVWSPRSNLRLYGATADIPQAVAAGVTVSLGADWCVSGSEGVLDELAVADSLNQAAYGGLLSDQDLVDMVTVNPARALARARDLGRIGPGYLADLTVVAPVAGSARRALIEAKPEDVRLVMVEGRALYGTVSLMDALHPQGETEPFFPCEGVERRILFHLDDPGVPFSNETLAEVTTTLGTAYAELLSLVSCVATAVPPGAAPSPLALRVGPVPFQHELEIQLSSTGAGGSVPQARVTVYDVRGREIRTLFEGRLPAQGKGFVWDGRDRRGVRVSSGVYFVRAVVGRERTSRSVILLR